jgi:uncharacterized protein (DUF1800 family)
VSGRNLVALTRFGLGARPNEVARLPAGWLEGQLRSPSLVKTERAAVRLQKLFAGVNSTERLMDALKAGRPLYMSDMTARTNALLTSPSPFLERLVLFWSNHFAVSVAKPAIAPLVYPYEQEAIRTYVLGRFEDMLLAVTRHPAMMIYLDNVRSVGDEAVAAKVRQARQPDKPKVGLNENFAREVMELHTLGVDGGYTQTDVRSLAKILSGWGIGRQREGAGEFVFRAISHEPGSHTVMGRVFHEAGEAQGVAALKFLARHPATAQHMATKLARHFISDDPPASAVQRLARVFYESQGNLAAVTQALINEPECWNAPPTKLKSPFEFVISSLRALGVKQVDREIVSTYELLGQRQFGSPSPQGWPDTEGDWLSGESLQRRIKWAYALTQRLPKAPDARAWAADILGSRLDADTARLIAGAPTNAEGLALTLISPAFLRR